MCLNLYHSRFSTITVTVMSHFMKDLVPSILSVGSLYRDHSTNNVCPCSSFGSCCFSFPLWRHRFLLFLWLHRRIIRNIDAVVVFSYFNTSTVATVGSLNFDCSIDHIRSLRQAENTAAALLSLFLSLLLSCFV